jgi:hydroxymethylpyrimidine/phosphomethylpyrimidine kinase
MSIPTGRILIIAGSDSGGGAGIQGDIKTVHALGGYAMTAITALTAQNTLGVDGIYPVPSRFVAKQITMCLQDIGADVIKTGMLHTIGIIHTIAEIITAKASDIPLVVDPVMVAKGGAPLLKPEAVEAMKTLLLPRATLITPNLPEAELLLGHPIETNTRAMQTAAEALLKLGAGAVLLKGGHSAGSDLFDVLVTRGSPPLVLSAPHRDTPHTHGTGCAFASAIATYLAQKQSLSDAVWHAHAYVQAAIGRAPGFGQGHGPLGH